MRIEYDTPTALRLSRENTNRAWAQGKEGTTARERFEMEGPLNISHEPKFMLDPNDAIFTMGSCFAREIENFLIHKKIRVLNDGHGVEKKYFASWTDQTEGGEELSRGALNKYTAHSMAHEIQDILSGREPSASDLIQLKDDIWFDPHSAGLRPSTLANALHCRNRIRSSTCEIRNAGVVFLTLGLTETWIYRPANMAMNSHPGAEWLTRMKESFSFVDYGFSETLDVLTDMISTIRAQINSDIKFIITVSPVPFGATFKKQDAIVANSGSKSVLRAVAEELFRMYDFVDYYPSYEIATLSAREAAYMSDQLHIKSSMVNYIIHKFAKSYYNM